MARRKAGAKEGLPMLRSISCRVQARLLEAERGQGTVEYVGIVLAVAALLVAVAAAIDNKVGGPIATALVRRLQEAVTQVGTAKHG
jgi:Flp pilus assembly pilin Flp